MPRATQCLQLCLGSSGFSRAQRTLRALHASQPEWGLAVKELGREMNYSGIDVCWRETSAVFWRPTWRRRTSRIRSDAGVGKERPTMRRGMLGYNTHLRFVPVLPFSASSPSIPPLISFLVRATTGIMGGCNGYCVSSYWGGLRGVARAMTRWRTVTFLRFRDKVSALCVRVPSRGATIRQICSVIFRVCRLHQPSRNQD